FIPWWHSTALLWATRADGGAPSSWRSLGAPSGVTFRSAPAATSFHPNGVVVFVLGSDGNVWSTATYAGDWSDEVPLPAIWGHPSGYTLVGDPTAISTGDELIDLFATDTAGDLWRRTYDHGALSGWFFSPTPLGQPIDPGVDVAAMGTGRMLVTVTIHGSP